MADDKRNNANILKMCLVTAKKSLTNLTPAYNTILKNWKSLACGFMTWYGLNGEGEEPRNIFVLISDVTSGISDKRSLLFTPPLEQKPMLIVNHIGNTERWMQQYFHFLIMIQKNC